MPGLRENIMERLSRDLIIDPEFAALIPPLTPDEFSGLEKSILEEGCRDAIIVWGNIIVDGHNRFNICSKHNIPYRTEYRDFPNRETAMLWMLQNQLSRRNLNDFQRVEMVRKCEQAVKAQAEQRMLKGKSDPSVNLRKGRATQELGAMAGVSPSTYEHATAVLDKAPEPVIQAARDKTLSINAAYEITKLPEPQQAEIASRIQQGEKPKTALSHTKQKARETSVSQPPLTPQLVPHEPVQSLRNSEHLCVCEFSEGLDKLPQCPSDCLLLLWVKPELLQLALTSSLWRGSDKFSYKKIAFVWTYASSVQKVCLLGLRGNITLPDDWGSRVIDVQYNGSAPYPDEFNSYILELHNYLETTQSTV